MNVLETLSKELTDKDWTLEEKCYYIYLRSCQIFSYDPRYYFIILVLHDLNLHEKLRNLKIDLKNVENNLVICSSFSDQVLSPLLSELLGINSFINGIGHTWVNFHDSKRIIKADATANSDICRAKMQLTTYGYQPFWKEPGFDDTLKQMSQKFGYIKENFYGTSIKQYVRKLYEEYDGSDQDEFTIVRINKLKEMFGSFDKISGFTDASFAISYLEKAFFKDEIDNIGLVQLFENHSDDDWDFYNIYTYELENQVLYYILRKVEQQYRFQEITQSDAVQYVKSLKGMGRELIQL